MYYGNFGIAPRYRQDGAGIRAEGKEQAQSVRNAIVSTVLLIVYSVYNQR
jgi:hypothetical protein